MRSLLLKRLKCCEVWGDGSPRPAALLKGPFPFSSKLPNTDPGKKENES